MRAISCRRATLDDARDILVLLLELAADIPLLVDTLEREEALYALIRLCARSGESWVACDAAGQIVGAVLAERPERGRHYAEHEVVDVRHAAARAVDGDDALALLIEQVQSGMVPVVVTVSPQNRDGLAEVLERKGFRPVGGPGGERRYRWQPGE